MKNERLGSADQIRRQVVSEPQVANGQGVTRTEFLIQLNSERLARVEQGLERNWMFHLVLAGVGLSIVFDIGDLPKVLWRYISQQEYDLRPVAAILLSILLYYFMKLGHLLTTFVEIRKLNDRLLEEYLGERKRDLEALRTTESFFEVYYEPNAFSRSLVAAYYLLCSMTVSAGQAAALYLIFEAYGMNLGSLAVVALAFGVMVLLYIGFWRSLREHTGTTKIVIACSVMTILLCAAFIIWA